MKVLFVGLGGIGQRHLRNLRAQCGSDVEVHAYRVRRNTLTLTDQLDVDTGVNLETKYDVRVHLDLDEALGQKPAIVFICNPSSLHIPVARKAVAAGCSLFVEKPLSHNLDGVAELIEETTRRRLVGFVGYQLRFHPCLKAVHGMLHEGRIGRPLAARVEVGEYLPGWHRYEDYRQMYASRADLGGGVILAQIHELDYLYWLFGMPRRVFTLGGHYSSLEIDVEDVASSTLEFSHEGRPLAVHLHQDYLQRPPSRGCMILGDEGKIVMDLRSATVERYQEGKLAERLAFPDFPRNQLFMDEMRHFLACVRGEETPLISLADGAASLKMALASRESLQTGHVVDLAQ